MLAVHPRLSNSAHLTMFLIGDDDKFQEAKRADTASPAEWLGEAVGAVTGSPIPVSLTLTHIDPMIFSINLLETKSPQPSARNQNAKSAVDTFRTDPRREDSSS